MNADNGWQPLIERLGRVLSDRPRLASRVLQQIEEQCEPVREHSKTRDRMLPSRNMLRWGAAGLSSIAAGLLFAFWIFYSSPTLAFAQVQAALREIKTAIIETQYPDNPSANHRVLVSSEHDLFRMEDKNSDVVIIQSREGKTLTLNTKQRIAQISPGAGFGLEGEEPSPRALLVSLQEVQKNAVKSLGKKSFDGRELVGFEVPAGYHSRRYIWVDPVSHLPVREELTPVEGDKPVSEKTIQMRHPRTVVTYQFNVELKNSLFSLDPPEGYKLVDGRDFQLPGRELPKRPVDFDASKYVITPGLGIGAVRFGMTKEQVIAALGKPDTAEQFGGFNAEQQKEMDELDRRAKEEKWDEYRVTREHDRLMRSVKSFERAGDGLFYRSLGFWVSVRDDKGVQGFNCSPKTSVFQMFEGKTDRGISMNSTLADVKRVYGEPTETFEPKGLVIVTFDKLGLTFTFGADGKMQDIGVNPTKDK